MDFSNYCCILVLHNKGICCNFTSIPYHAVNLVKCQAKNSMINPLMLMSFGGYNFAIIYNYLLNKLNTRVVITTFKRFQHMVYELKKIESVVIYGTNAFFIKYMAIAFHVTNFGLMKSMYCLSFPLITFPHQQTPCIVFSIIKSKFMYQLNYVR